MMQKPFTISWSNILVHLELAAILCLAISVHIMDASAILSKSKNFKNEAHEEKKSSKANVIVHSAHYDGNRKFILEHYYNLVTKHFSSYRKQDLSTV